MSKDENGFEKPNFTPTPNDLFDILLPQIDTLAELKITLAVVRQTFGWDDGEGNRKQEDELSFTQFQKKTGLSRQAVSAGIKAGLDRGILQRRKVGQSFLYSALVKNLDQSTNLTETSQESRPKLVKEVDTQKKTKEKKKTTSYDVRGSFGVSLSYKPAPPPPKPESKPKRTPKQQANDDYWDAVVEGSGIDASRDGNKKFVGRAVRQLKSTCGPPGQIRLMLKTLRKICRLDTTVGKNLLRAVSVVQQLLTANPPYNARELAADFTQWWRRHDWRGQKGQPPTPEQVVAEIGHIRVKGQQGSRDVQPATPEAIAALKNPEVIGEDILPPVLKEKRRQARARKEGLSA